ncbi:hypothetical protein D3C71_1621290 [compost metagenome]
MRKPVRRQGPRRPGRGHFHQGTAAQRHHHCAGVRQRASAIGELVLRSRRAARPADDRRQGDDGPQRPGLPDRHRRIQLRRKQGADRALARQGSPALCGDPTLRADQYPGTTDPGRPVADRIPGSVHADPHQRKPQGNRVGQGAVPGAQGLPGRLRSLPVARRALGVRPRRAPVR